MTLGVPSEILEGEKRVSLTPEGVKTLKEKNFSLIVQAGAGANAGFTDEAYIGGGAEVVPAASDVFQGSDLVVRINGPSEAEVKSLKEGSGFLSFLYPASNLEIVKGLAAKNVSAFAMELVPRITRAQSLDALSSFSTILGYKAALSAADHLNKFFPMFMTAAGSIPPAKVFIIGAGVAGLQAIATCKRLGAVIEAFDVRPAVKEEVESLGGKFVQVAEIMEEQSDASGYAKEMSEEKHRKELELIAGRLAKCDVCITTALIPGRPAPKLITKDMLPAMKPGSVIVDLAAINGGNCEGTVPGQVVVVDGVTIVGKTSFLSEVALDASRMFSKNITEFLNVYAPDGNPNLDLEDPILNDMLVTHEGKVRHEPTRQKLEQGG